ncbi:MAG: FixH family protein [Pseudomonadota bacterium]
MTNDARPWFAQPLVWAVLSPLIVVVIACVWLVARTIDIGGVDALPGEYEKTGKVIALDAAALERSQALAPRATGTIDTVAGELRLTIDSSDLPTALAARLVHSTLPERDVEVSLAWTGDGFEAALPPALPDRGELHVFPDDRAWRLVAPLRQDAPLVFRASRR